MPGPLTAGTERGVIVRGTDRRSCGCSGISISRPLLSVYSPGSTPSATGDKGCFAPPPMVTMRSIARRALSATSAGTVMRCWSYSECVSHLGQRRDLHVCARRPLVRGEEALARILAPQTVQDSDLGRDDELVCAGQRRTLDHPFGRQNLDALRIDVAGRHRLEDARRAAALGVDQELGLGVQACAAGGCFRDRCRRARDTRPSTRACSAARSCGGRARRGTCQEGRGSPSRREWSSRPPPRCPTYSSSRSPPSPRRSC